MNSRQDRHIGNRRFQLGLEDGHAIADRDNAGRDSRPTRIGLVPTVKTKMYLSPTNLRCKRGFIVHQALRHGDKTVGKAGVLESSGHACQTTVAVACLNVNCCRGAIHHHPFAGAEVGLTGKKAVGRGSEGCNSFAGGFQPTVRLDGNRRHGHEQRRAEHGIAQNRRRLNDRLHVPASLGNKSPLVSDTMSENRLEIHNFELK